MAYSIELLPSAAKQLKKLSKKNSALATRLVRAIDKLATDPRGSGAIALSSSERLMRRRVGDYRIIYQIQDKKLLVVVAKVAHRRDVYE